METCMKVLEVLALNKASHGSEPCLRRGRRGSWLLSKWHLAGMALRTVIASV
jgi:hypothetical protein